ncbi:hypothetical protein [Glutamicibacter mishrai]|uniref:hypothetical protein n=1 Tax=Glutamicibacter mishrai TaxID=1775880 RepID=UPI0015591F10|nr:hypothetical protein [Glutamicibacter mishrai]
MDYYEDPYSPGLYRYETNRYPYVEVEHDGELFHAQAQGWKGNMLMIARIKNQLGRVDNGAKETLWIPANSCQRIRREDSTWVTTEDDHEWHKSEDQKIKYRADPWTVYA